MLNELNMDNSESVNTDHLNNYKNIEKNYETTVKPILHVEIIQKIESFLKKEELIFKVDKYLKEENCLLPETVRKSVELPSGLSQHINEVKLCELDSTSGIKHINPHETDLKYYTYKLDGGGPGVEEMGGGDNGGGEDVPAATHWLLPSFEFRNLWDTLVFDTNVKEQLVRFVSTTLLFSDHGVDSDIISWNRVLLLHGPPGTGKTSLCKALSQKLSIRLGHKYQYGQLFEVNSHSLFSKWFSESGKLVEKLFLKMKELVEDPKSLVCVLIDEVESLTRTREATANGSDPSDALRVVNALLTQLDQIKRYPNVLILTTSNVTGTIDLAFVDRADIKQYIGLPSQEAIYQIYYSCLIELMNVGVVCPKEQLLTFRQLKITNMTQNNVTKPSLNLWKVSGESAGMSGRTLRKIPFLAHALHVKDPVVSLQGFIVAMEAAVQKHLSDSSYFDNAS